MTVVIRKVLPEEVEELKVISEDTFRETFAHDNTDSQLQAYFDTALSEEVLLDEITHEESRYFFIIVDDEKAGFLKTNVGSAQTEQHLDNAFQIQRIYISQAFQGMGLGYGTDGAAEFDRGDGFADRMAAGIADDVRNHTCVGAESCCGRNCRFYVDAEGAQRRRIMRDCTERAYP